LLLRHDNAENRLLKYGYEVGLIPNTRYQEHIMIEQQIQAVIEQLKNKYILPNDKINTYLKDLEKSLISSRISYHDFLKRPETNFNDLEFIIKDSFDFDDFIKDQIMIAIKYQGYIQKEIKNARKLQVMESRVIPDDLDYDKIANIASEAKDKLKKLRPHTLSQASRISGVNPSDISVLLVYLESRKRHG
jgi:tRNA uridine 5-carboxymethylaminomethyl modification enzyme